MAPLAKLQWLYILFVLTGIVIGVYGIRATIMLIKGSDKSYRNALYTLIAGVVVGFIHIYVSRMLRGKSMPVDAVVYTTLLTMIIFLLFRIPYLWNGLNFNKGSDKTSHIAGGSAAILLGMFTLTIQYTMASTHTWGGVNFANAFNTTMLTVGSVLVLSGAGYLIRFKNIRMIRPNPFLNSQHQTL
jgi:drug/metabolite transporter (DMT)-like permease